MSLYVWIIPSSKVLNAYLYKMILYKQKHSILGESKNYV